MDKEKGRLTKLEEEKEEKPHFSIVSWEGGKEEKECGCRKN